MKNDPRDSELKRRLARANDRSAPRSGRKLTFPIRIGACTINEQPYKDQLRWHVTARSPRLHRSFRNCRQAVDFANEEHERRTATTDTSRITFKDASNEWIKWCEQRSRAKDPSISANTVCGYRIALEKCQAKFGRKLLSDGNWSHLVEDWLEELAQDYKRSTIYNFHLPIDQTMKYAVRRKMTLINPLLIDKIKIRGSRQKRAEIPDRADMEVLREFLNSPRPEKHSRMTWSSMRIAIMLAASCGLRRGEVCGLRWNDIDPATGELTVNQIVTPYPNTHVQPYGKTGASFRRVPIKSNAFGMLNKHAKVYEKFFGRTVGHIVRNDRLGEFIPGAQIGEPFRLIMRKAGLLKSDGKPKFTFHALRHWCASNWMRDLRGDVERVRKLIGHENASLTMDRYGHVIDDPEWRARYEQLHDWLDLIQTDQPARIVPPRPQPLPAPLPVSSGPVIDGVTSVVIGPPPEGPIPPPEWAEGWLRRFLILMWQHGQIRDALRAIGKTRRQVETELRRCRMPPIGEVEALALAAVGDQAIGAELAELPAIPDAPCPLDIPELAPQWLRVLIRLLDRDMTFMAACEAVRKAPDAVRDELRRMKLPQPHELKRRLWSKKVMALFDQGYQDHEIAEKVGSHPVQINSHLRKLKKTRRTKPPKTKENSLPAGPLPSPGTKPTQLRFL